MGRKKKEKDTTATESREKDEEEADIEPEKKTGRRSTKPVVAKWAVGETISGNFNFCALTTCL